ncbi:MAG: ABC transporter ATP-binding protein/permease [Alphaproteobacteria bacterium]|nr:ABC transporter ATP-binding protein/permease [Alphaproteobacteria bacterium]
MNGKRRTMLRLAWRLARPYWSSEEKRIAWALLIAVIALNLGNVYVSVRINAWNNAFYNALQEFNAPEFFKQLGIFCGLAAASIAMSVYAVYLQQMLQIRWRRWLTGRYLDRWLGDRRYYRLQLDRTITDNPDQRIADDLRLYVSYVATLALGLLSSAVSLVSFMVILVGLSGPAAIPLGPLGTVHIPAYLAWAALIYAGLGTWITVKIGRPLVPLNFAQQRFEADFRYSLVRLRENAESVALYGGEPPERKTFDGRFSGVFDNFWRIMLRQKKLNWFTSGYSQVAAVFPVLVVSPRYFAKQIQMGGLFQVVDAFSNVQSSLSFIINSFTDIATWVAVTERLTTFEQRMDEIESSLRAPQPIRLRREGTGVEMRDLDLDLPDGAPLLRGVSLRVEPGGSLLITGPSGTGKSTLLRAAAGIWPYGKGEVRLGAGRTFFMPQRPYFPLGTLKQALAYPALDSAVDETRMTEALERVGLGMLTAHLTDDQNWPLRLSLGEQQRVAFARVLLAQPDLIFLDEASSAVDEDDEARLYRLLRDRHSDAVIISVGHRESLKALHDRVVDLTRFHAGALVAE